jgi:hypothetical protein
MNNLEELACIFWEKSFRPEFSGFPAWKKLPRFFKDDLICEIALIIYLRESSKSPSESPATDETH